MSADTVAAVSDFERSGALFGGMTAFLEGPGAAGLTHAELETRVQVDGRELLRVLCQDHLDLRARREGRISDAVGDGDGVPRRAAESGHRRPLASVFGVLEVQRIAYRAGGALNLHPADGALNLPVERASHGLRRVAAIESARGSYEDAVDAVERQTGQQPGKRQVQQLADRASSDFDAFYAGRDPAGAEDGDLLVLSCDGKGVVMRPGALRPATAKAAAAATTKLKTRLSKGEKHNRKRIAEVGAVYDASPAPRTIADVLGAAQSADGVQPDTSRMPGPTAENKWLTASIVDDAATVVAAIFDEALRRDPAHARTWVALVDGNCHQIDRIQAEARARGTPVNILIDLVHVIEYVWSAAWSFHKEGDPAAEQWVHLQLTAILDGNARQVAANIRRAATRAGLDPKQRAGADACAKYLTNKSPYLDYPTALTSGWPIATGVIEGACRHVVKDRMDITGARWGLPGAEAILKLRAIYCNGDFDAYWDFHLTQEHQRVHKSRYANNTIPATPQI